MANLSKFVNQNQNSIMCAAGVLASLWILVYGRQTHKRWVFGKGSLGLHTQISVLTANKSRLKKILL